MKSFSAWLAAAFGTFLAVAEVLRNSGEVQWWPFWVVDAVAVGLLLWGAATALRLPAARAGAILCAGWGFACAMFWMSFFGHLDDLRRDGVAVAQTNAQSALDEPALTIAIGVLFAITIVGLVTSLVATTRSSG